MGCVVGVSSRALALLWLWVGGMRRVSDEDMLARRGLSSLGDWVDAEIRRKAIRIKRLIMKPCRVDGYLSSVFSVLRT